VECHVVGEFDGDLTFNVGNNVSSALELHHSEVGFAYLLLRRIKCPCCWTSVQS
jgi:hypothetical protein